MVRYEETAKKAILKILNVFLLEICYNEGELIMYNILVCDDDKDIVKAIEIYLNKEGYKIEKEV